MQSFKDGTKERAYFKQSELYHYTSMIWHIYRQNDFKCLCVYSPGLQNLLLSYEKIKHIVEVDEKILAVFTINSDSRTSDIFIAPDAKIDSSFIEIVRSRLDLKSKTTDKAVVEEEEEEEKSTQMIGKHLWDISEYDKIRVIRIYEANRLIVVLAKSHTPPGDTADTVLGYLYESNEDNTRQESPPCLF